MTTKAFKMNVQSGIAERLKMTRQMAGLSQEQMAYKIGVLQGNISQYELARTMPRLNLLVQYAMHCNTTPVWLLTGEGDSYPHMYKVGQQPLPYPAQLAYEYSNIIDISNMGVSSRFRALRKMIQLSQHQFADSLPYSRTSLSYWESGRCLPRVDHILAVANHVKCNAWWLAFGIGVAWPQK